MSEPAAIKTLLDLYRRATTVEKRDLLNFKVDGAWRALPASEVAAQVRAVAMGLYALGVRASDHVGLLSENRVEWTMADWGVLNCGAADVPIYATQSPKQAAYILQDAGAEVLFISNQAQYDRVREALHDCPKLRVIISFDPVAAPRGKVMSWADLLNWGRAAAEAEPELYETLQASVQPESLATLIYTSGTTGDPKGVMLTHSNLVANVTSTAQIMNVTADDPVLTFLPFSHIFERAVMYYYLYVRATIYYAQSVDTVGDDLAEVQPFYMTSVPRLFEKIYARALEKAEAKGATTARIARWALEVAKEWAEAASNHRPISLALKIKHKLADELVFSKWRAAVGGRIKYFVSGGAPLAPELARIFYGAGLPILQGYGLTESSPGITSNSATANRLGSVGRALPGVMVKIASDGEILCSGANVMQGYYDREEETAEALERDADGRVWLHTGDVGYLDDDGYLFITDRKKDLLKTSGGKYVAPQPIETAIKRSRYVNQVVVIGDERKFPAALIVPQMEAVRAYAAQHNLAANSDAELLKDPQIVNLFEREVAQHTSDLSQYEKVKAVLLLEKEMTIESGELTPTLKVKRRVVEEKHKRAIDELYAQKGGLESPSPR